MDREYRSELENLICYIVRFGEVADDKDPLYIEISNIYSRLKLRKNQLMDIFGFHLNIFKICNRDTVVKLIIPVKICPAFCSGDDCLKNNCGMFHICKFYALSDTCKFNPCKFGHSLKDGGHNQLIINQWMLNNLNIDDFRKLFRLLVNRTSATLPQICDFYNKQFGCNKGDNCTCLHICKHYVWGTCKFSQQCKRSHDIDDITDTLQRYGIDIERRPTEILDTLKYMYETFDDACSHPAIRNSKMPSSQRGGNTGNICLFHLRGRCLYGQNCRNEHKKKPFQWQRKDNQSAWIDFPDDVNVKIEQAFCSLIEECSYIIGSGRVYKINFTDLPKSDEQIQRLSTIGYSKDSNFADRLLTTRWLWYWESDSGWTEYGTQDKVGFRGTATSQMIEDKFSNGTDLTIEFDSQHPFGARGHSYILDFTKMIQKNQNIIYGTERRVIRRPEFADQKVLDEREAQIKQLKKASHLTKPETWDMPDGTDIFSHFQIVQVFFLQEYKDIKRYFEDSNDKRSKVTSIRRVENGELWRAFSESIDALTRKLKRKIEPTRLFHGTTSDLVEAIARQGFDCRLAGSRVGHLYGLGGYFGKTSSLSALYCDGEKKMIVAKVLVGDVTKGKPDMLRPPPKNPADPYGELYDSTVDDQSDPNIFVKFDNNHTYPEYLITFQ